LLFVSCKCCVVFSTGLTGWLAG